jgi:hypothetical protein
MAEHALHELMPTFARSLANMTPVAPTTTYVADVLDGASSTDTSIAINPNEAQQVTFVSMMDQNRYFTIIT